MGTIEKPSEFWSAAHGPRSRGGDRNLAAFGQRPLAERKTAASRRRHRLRLVRYRKLAVSGTNEASGHARDFPDARTDRFGRRDPRGVSEPQPGNTRHACRRILRPRRREHDDARGRRSAQCARQVCGALAAAEISGRLGAIVLTSRISVEMVQKAAAIGAGIVLAISAPTALAIRTAAASGITLVGIARGRDFEIFSQPAGVALY